jgi:hypothetical protein
MSEAKVQRWHINAMKCSLTRPQSTEVPGIELGIGERVKEQVGSSMDSPLLIVIFCATKDDLNSSLGNL